MAIIVPVKIIIRPDFTHWTFENVFSVLKQGCLGPLPCVFALANQQPASWEYLKMNIFVTLHFPHSDFQRGLSLFSGEVAVSEHLHLRAVSARCGRPRRRNVIRPYYTLVSVHAAPQMKSSPDVQL